jgi:hypothetical protein
MVNAWMNSRLEHKKSKVTRKRLPYTRIKRLSHSRQIPGNILMSDSAPQITTLKPVVLPDNHRVIMQMVVENLPESDTGSACAVNSNSPPYSPSNIQLFADTTDLTSPDGSNKISYPDVELSIFDSKRREVASLLIIEHREPVTDLTLHLRSPKPEEQYTASAKITLDNEVIEVVEVPFTLNPVE